MKYVTGLLDHFNDLEKDFHHSFAGVLLHCKEEDVHRLRVNLKRQVAFFHLLEFLDPGFSASRAMEAYGKLYKRAGKVRNYQVEKKVIRQEEDHLELANVFSEWLSGEENRRREKLKTFEEEQSLIPVRRLAKLVRNRIQYLTDETVRENFPAYFAHLFSALREWMKEGIQPEERLHELRKVIKELFFNLDLINGMCARARIHKREIKTLDNFQKVLGDWHDRFFTLECIGKGQENCPEEIVKRLEKNKKKYVGRIKARLRKLPALIDRLEPALADLFEKEQMESERSARQRKRAHATRPSFSQVNVGEGTK